MAVNGYGNNNPNVRGGGLPRGVPSSLSPGGAPRQNSNSHADVRTGWTGTPPARTSSPSSGLQGMSRRQPFAPPQRSSTDSMNAGAGMQPMHGMGFNAAPTAQWEAHEAYPTLKRRASAPAIMDAGSGMPAVHAGGFQPAGSFQAVPSAQLNMPDAHPAPPVMDASAGMPPMHAGGFQAESSSPWERHPVPQRRMSEPAYVSMPGTEEQFARLSHPYSPRPASQPMPNHYGGGAAPQVPQRPQRAHTYPGAVGQSVQQPRPQAAHGQASTPETPAKSSGFQKAFRGIAKFWNEAMGSSRKSRSEGYNTGNGDSGGSSHDGAVGY